MELSPTSAPVYGGRLLEVNLFNDVEILDFARIFLVFDGTKQRQITEAKIIDNRRFQAVIPDHEPPEEVTLSLVVKYLSGEPGETIAQESFGYYLDQTCYLARYLADSVHDLEALEDWDCIRGPQFSLADEDFPTLDERLTSAFQHLILPPTWNLLGDPSTAEISRETLFHFAARLGLSSFVTLLLEKRGAAQCLQIHNKHDELAKNIARSKSYDGLADLITDPHAHGVIRWESTHRMSSTTTIKKHSYGTVTTSTEMQNGEFPSKDEEIDAIIEDHPTLLMKVTEQINTDGYNEIIEEQYDTNSIDVTNTTNATWGSEDISPQIVNNHSDIPPPVPPKPKNLYLDYEYDSSEENEEQSEYTQNESSYFSPDSIDYLEEDSHVYHGPNNADDDEILGDNLRHLKKISTNIHCIRQKDIARLKQSSPTETGRLSNSCPNLGQDSSFISTDTEYLEAFDSPAGARSRQALPHGLGMQHFDAEFQSSIGPYNSADDLSKPHTRSPVYLPDPSPPPVIINDQNHVEEVGGGEYYVDDDEEEEIPSQSNRVNRPHSWHSVEKLNELEPDTAPKALIHSHKRSQSYQGDESSSMTAQNAELTVEEQAEQADTITSPSIRRVRRHNNNAFAIVSAENRNLKARSVSLSVNNNNNAVKEPDRRFTISEGVISTRQHNSLLALQELIRQHDELNDKDTNGSEDGDPFTNGPRQMSLSEFLADPANFETDEDTPTRTKPSITTGFAAKPFVPPRPDVGPASKNIVSRKLSFLTKMRSSTRTKMTGTKDRIKKIADSKGNLVHKPPLPDDNLGEGKDKDSLRDLPWHTVKNKTKKANALNAQQQQRPQSMMINKLPTTYGGSLPGNTYYQSDMRVHGLPPSRLPFRPLSSYESGKSFDSAVTDGKLTRNSYKDEGDSSSLHSGSRTPPHISQYNNVSGSIESLDEVAFDLAELQNDPDLMLKENEPEAWSVTVDKKSLGKMHKKDVKRQDNIFEFIQKERNFLTTLKIMQKIFANGMARELQMDQDVIDKMFPKIDEFVEFTSAFVEQINQRQHEGQAVSHIGDILVNQWSTENGRHMLYLYSEFCSKQKEIVSMYKEMLKNDKKFLDFTTRCGKNMLTRRRDIPGCVLLVTQRITKYPVILKTLIDNSTRKEHKADCSNLNTALELITDIIKKVDNQVLQYEKQQKVKDIHQKMESKSYATYKDGRKFTRDDFLDSVGKILQVSELQWKPNSMKRPIDVTVLLFKDVLVFLQESSQRYSFASVGQPASVPLHKLIVREKAGEDSVLFLISASSDKPEMYEIVFQTVSESKNWMQWIRAAVDVCPEEDEGVSHQDVEEQKLMERKWEQAHQLISELEKRDQEVNDKLQEKMEKFKMLVKVLERPECTANMKFGYPTYLLNTNDAKTKTPLGAPILQKAIEQVNKLSHAICGPGGLSRNPSSVGEHDSGTYPTPSLPKRSETFGGFDNGKEPSSPRSKYASSLTRVGSSQDNITSSSDESKRDSGLIDGEMSQAGSEQLLTGYSSCNSSPMASGQGLLLPPTSDQISALAQLTHLLNEYVSIATQQDTHVQKMSVKMTQAQGRRRNGNQFQEHEFKRNQLKQTEQEQDLQKREEQLKSEKDQWNKKFKRFQAANETERKENDISREKIKRDAMEVERQQEEVRKVKEECQRQMARLRELQRKVEKSDSSMQHANTYPTSLANRNNSNSTAPFDEDDFSVDDIRQNRLGSMPSSLSKSHSSLEGELSSGDNTISKDSTSSPTYATSADYPKTFPGTGKLEKQAFLSNQHHHSVQPPIPNAGQTGIPTLPIHLQYSATNQVLGHVAPPRHSVIPGNLSSSSKPTKQGQVIPSKLTKLAGLQSSQPSGKHSGLKSKLPFTHHKKATRSTNSSSELVETRTTRSNTLSVPNNLKHSKSEANMEVSNNRGRSTSSPSPVTNLLPPDLESGLERSNSASSNSSKEGTDKKKKGKRRSWGSNSDKQNDKPNEKEIYF